MSAIGARLVPSNLMAWSRVRNLLPDQKLIVYHLWATMHEACGCGLLDIAHVESAINIKENALLDTLDEFEKRGLLTLDRQSGEVFINDWYRCHTFSTPTRKRLLEDSIKRIQSPSLRSIVEKTKTCALREGKEMEGKERKPPPANPEVEKTKEYLHKLRSIK